MKTSVDIGVVEHTCQEPVRERQGPKGAPQGTVKGSAASSFNQASSKLPGELPTPIG